MQTAKSIDTLRTGTAQPAESNRPSRARIVAANMYLNVALNWKTLSKEGSTHWGWPVERSIEYITNIYRDYFDYSGLAEDDVAGKRLLELGPGDNLGVALLLVAAGASHVTAIDRFAAHLDNKQQVMIYSALRDRLTPEQRKRFDDAVELGTEAKFNTDRIRFLYGVGAEKSDELLPGEQFDLIISRGVLLRIVNLKGCMKALDRLLKPGGKAIHKVAFIDWSFRKNGYHPLEFLTVSDPVYRMMSGNTGICYRYTIDDYRRLSEELGYKVELHITRTLCGDEKKPFAPRTFQIRKGEHYDEATLGLVREMRPRMIPRFRDLPDETLLTEDMFLVVDKPA